MNSNLAKRNSNSKPQGNKGKKGEKGEHRPTKKIQGNSGKITSVPEQKEKKTTKNPANKLYSQLIQKEKGAKDKKVQLIKKILGLIEPVPKVSPLFLLPNRSFSCTRHSMNLPFVFLNDFPFGLLDHPPPRWLPNHPSHFEVWEQRTSDFNSRPNQLDSFQVNRPFEIRPPRDQTPSQESQQPPQLLSLL